MGIRSREDVAVVDDDDDDDDDDGSRSGVAACPRRCPS